MFPKQSLWRINSLWSGRITWKIGGYNSCLLSFLYPLKTSEKLWFSDVFRGYRKRSVAWKGLKSIFLLRRKLSIDLQVKCFDWFIYEDIEMGLKLKRRWKDKMPLSYFQQDFIFMLRGVCLVWDHCFLFEVFVRKINLWCFKISFPRP